MADNVLKHTSYNMRLLIMVIWSRGFGNIIPNQGIHLREAPSVKRSQKK